MKILLVEDHDALRHNIEAVLKSEGYTVVSCADGIDAEFQIMNNSSDLILLDRMLPGQDGLTITRKARAQGITTPILMLTALDSLGDKVSGLDAGADDYIVKPFAMEELLARLRIWSPARSSVAQRAGRRGNPAEAVGTVDGTPFAKRGHSHYQKCYFQSDLGAGCRGDGCGDRHLYPFGSAAADTSAFKS